MAVLIDGKKISAQVKDECKERGKGKYGCYTCGNPGWK